MGFVTKTVNALEDKLNAAVGNDVATSLNPVGTARRKSELEDAAAVQNAANEQASAVRASAQAAAKASQEAASQSARQQEQTAARKAAESAAADALDKPLENADVQIGGTPVETASAASRRRRQTFGVGSAGSGVNI